MAVSLGGAALLGRRAVNRQIEQRLPTEIETARNIAILELDKQIQQVIAERLASFSLSLLIKAGLIGAAYLMFTQGHLTATGLQIVVAFLLVLFVARDILKTLPFLAPALHLVRRHHWNFRTAVKEFVAGVAFERAYAEAMVAMESGPNRLWIALSKYTAHSLSEDVANAVAEVARTTSFRRARNRVLLALGAALVMSAAYIGFFLLTIGNA